MNQNRAVLKKGHQKIYLRDREKNRSKEFLRDEKYPDI